MSYDPRAPRGETPRSEPEIIPPSRGGRGTPRDDALWGQADRHGVYRVYIGKLRPPGLFLVSLGIALFALCVVFLVAGAILIWLPVVALLVAGSIIATLLRQLFR